LAFQIVDQKGFRGKGKIYSLIKGTNSIESYDVPEIRYRNDSDGIGIEIFIRGDDRDEGEKQFGGGIAKQFG